MDGSLARIVAESLNINPSDLRDDMGIGNPPEWDSLASVLIVSRVAQEMGVEIPFERMAEISTLSELRKIVEGGGLA